MTQVRIIRIHNELLGTYGDQGNAEVLAFRARHLGLTPTVIDVTYDQSIPRDGNIYLLGGAENAAQLLSVEAMKRDNALKDAIADGATLLAVCAGFQIIGNSFWANDKQYDGLGLLDVESTPGEKMRCVGDVKAHSAHFNVDLIGFENHAGRTILGPLVQPFAKVSQGFGNGDGKTDGAIQGNVIGTYMHGPILARTPALADQLLLKQKRLSSKKNFG